MSGYGLAAIWAQPRHRRSQVGVGAQVLHPALSAACNATTSANLLGAGVTSNAPTCQFAYCICIEADCVEVRPNTRLPSITHTILPISIEQPPILIRP